MIIIKRFCVMAFVITVCLFLLLRYSGISQIKYIRTQIVATAMTTQSHQSIAFVVASMDEIDIIIASAITESDIKSTIDGVMVLDSYHCTKGFDFLEEGIYIREISKYGFDGKLMLVLDPSRIFIGTAQDLGWRGSTVREMAEVNGAIAGINGGFFSGPMPTGFVISDNRRVFPCYNYTYITTIVGFTNCNILVIGAYTEKEALSVDIRDSLSTFPITIVNGEPQITEGDGGWGIAPRTAIAQRKDGAVLFLVIEGRRMLSLGATLRQAQDILMENNAYNAIFLDGGSSSVMFYRGSYLTTPSLGFERDIPTAFLVR